jgi:hypothetical protein
MKKKAQFTHFIRPVCMPPKRRSFVNELATVVGWGATDFGNYSSFLVEHKISFSTVSSS